MLLFPLIIIKKKSNQNLKKSQKRRFFTKLNYDSKILFNFDCCCNLGQNIADKCKKLNKDFSIEDFTADFLQFCSTTIKILINSKHFSGFL